MSIKSGTYNEIYNKSPNQLQSLSNSTENNGKEKISD